MTAPRIHANIEDAITDVRLTPGHTVASIAGQIGVPPKRLYDAVDPTDAQPFHAAWIVPITNITGNYAIHHFLANGVGGVFVKLPERADASLAGMTQAVGELMREVADVIAAASDAIKDNRIEPAEKALLLQQLREVKVAVERAESLVLAIPDVPTSGGSR